MTEPTKTSQQQQRCAWPKCGLSEGHIRHDHATSRHLLHAESDSCHNFIPPPPAVTPPDERPAEGLSDGEEQFRQWYSGERFRSLDGRYAYMATWVEGRKPLLATIDSLRQQLAETQKENRVRKRIGECDRYQIGLIVERAETAERERAEMRAMLTAIMDAGTEAELEGHIRNIPELLTRTNRTEGA